MNFHRATHTTITAALIGAILANACGPSSSARRTGRLCAQQATTADLFFPPDAFVPQLVDVDDELRETLGRYFQAANERSWICGEVPSEGYRLFIGGGYGLPGIVASASRTSSGWGIAVSEFERLAPGTAFQVTKRSTHEIQNLAVSDIRQALQRASFWSGPTWQQVEGEGDVIMIETLDGVDHRAVVQAVPTPEFRNAAAQMLRLTMGSDAFLRARQSSR